MAEEAATPLRWEEITSSTAEDLARKEQRRGILPRLLQAARVGRLELRRKQYEQEADPLYAEREQRYAKLEKAKDKERRATEEREAALVAWNITHSAIQSAEDRIRRTEREIRELREAR